MIDALILRNFQSHKKTELVFHPNINAIIGTSNSGKTAILRGLYWVIYNRPSGLSFISHWNRDKKGNAVKETSASIMQDGFAVQRIRNSEMNGYTIAKEETETVNTLEAIGMDVPEEVTKCLNLGEVNIQKQMDAPFLLSESAGEVARFFNKEIRLDLIDKILGTAESKRRQFNSDIKQLDVTIAATEKELLQYEMLETANTLCEKLKTIDEGIEANQIKMDVIDNLHAQYIDEIETAKKYKNIKFEEIQKTLDALDEIKKKELENKELLDNVFKMINSRIDSTQEMNRNKAELKQLIKELPAQCPLCGNKMEADSCKV